MCMAWAVGVVLEVTRPVEAVGQEVATAGPAVTATATQAAAARLVSTVGCQALLACAI